MVKNVKKNALAAPHMKRAITYSMCVSDEVEYISMHMERDIQFPMHTYMLLFVVKIIIIK